VEHHDGPAAVQLLEQRLLGGVAQVLAIRIRQQRDPVGTERVERILELGQRRADIGQRHAGEQAEAGRSLAHELGDLIVEGPREPRRRRVVTEVDAGG
jgi:hypothetical protein